MQSNRDLSLCNKDYFIKYNYSNHCLIIINNYRFKGTCLLISSEFSFKKRCMPDAQRRFLNLRLSKHD